MPADLGDEKQVGEHHAQLDSERAAELADLGFVMSTQRGRRVVNRMIVFSEVLGELFSPNGSIQSRNLGRRDYGIKLIKDLERHFPELYLLMRQEYLSDKEVS
jgi:hypothetical protein